MFRFCRPFQIGEKIPPQTETVVLNAAADIFDVISHPLTLDAVVGNTLCLAFAALDGVGGNNVQADTQTDDTFDRMSELAMQFFHFADFVGEQRGVDFHIDFDVIQTVFGVEDDIVVGGRAFHREQSGVG